MPLTRHLRDPRADDRQTFCVSTHRFKPSHFGPGRATCPKCPGSSSGFRLSRSSSKRVWHPVLGSGVALGACGTLDDGLGVVVQFEGKAGPHMAVAAQAISNEFSEDGWRHEADYAVT